MAKKIDDLMNLDVPDEMFEDMLHSLVRNDSSARSQTWDIVQDDDGSWRVVNATSGWDPTDEEIEEFVESLHEWDDEPTDPLIPIPKTAHFDPEDIVEKRKRDGVCLKCGDRGEWIAGALFCRDKKHGKIMG